MWAYGWVKNLYRRIILQIWSQIKYLLLDVYADAPLFPYSSLFPQDIIQGVFGVHPVTTYIAWVSTKEFWIFMGIKETYSSILGINLSNLSNPMCVK